jgi:hypothetical protein
MTDEEFLALPYAEAMQHILRQNKDAEIVRLRNLWDGAYSPTTQKLMASKAPSPGDTPEPVLEGFWNVVGVLNILGALVVAAMLFNSEGGLVAAIAVLICAPLAALAPFSVAVMMGRARRIENHLALIAASSPRVGDSA